MVVVRTVVCDHEFTSESSVFASGETDRERNDYREGHSKNFTNHLSLTEHKRKHESTSEIDDIVKRGKKERTKSVLRLNPATLFAS